MCVCVSVPNKPCSVNGVFLLHKASVVYAQAGN